VFRSTDRGNTWEQRPFPPAPNADITFIDDHEGWVSLAGSGQQCDAPGITAWHTIDGGTSWEQPAPSGLADGRCKLNLSFTDGSHGFVDSFDPQRAAAIYRTTDAGKTWSAPSGLPDPPSSGTQPGAASLQPGKVRAFGATSLVTARDTARGRTFVFRSADGGATWQFAGVGPTMENGVALVTATRWLQIVPGGSSQETTDGGATWHAFATLCRLERDVVGDPHRVDERAGREKASAHKRGEMERVGRLLAICHGLRILGARHVQRRVVVPERGVGGIRAR